MMCRMMGTAGLLVLAVATGGVVAQEIKKRGDTSYFPIDIKESSASIQKRMKADKPKIEKRHQDVLTARYDLANRPSKDAAMFRCKPLKEGVQPTLKDVAAWPALPAMSPYPSPRR